jgi:hypothetical protein
MLASTLMTLSSTRRIPKLKRSFNSSSKRITIYNDNQAAVDWAASCINKGTKHINLRENYVCKRHQRGITKVTHIPGVINASDLFTKEMKDAAHFRPYRDSFMVSKSVFNCHVINPKTFYLFSSVQSKTTLEASRPPQPCWETTPR